MSTDSVLKLNSHAELLRALRGQKTLTLLIFSAEWCGPCKLAAEWFDEVKAQFKNAITMILIKQEIMQETFSSYEVTSLPTFVLISNASEVGRLSGNNKRGVIDMIQSFLSAAPDTQPIGDRASKDSIGKFVNLQSEIDFTKSHCLNVVSDKDWQGILTGSSTEKAFFIQSDVDAQLILTLIFPNPVHVYGFYMLGPEENGPKDVRVFANENRQMDFNYCEESEPIQKFTLSKRAIDGSSLSGPLLSSVHKFKSGIFKTITNLSFFINSNQSGKPDSSTVVTCLRVYGCPVDFSGVSLKNFKRVAGSPNTPHE